MSWRCEGDRRKCVWNGRCTCAKDWRSSDHPRASQDELDAVANPSAPNPVPPLPLSVRCLSPAHARVCALARVCGGVVECMDIDVDIYLHICGVSVCVCVCVYKTCVRVRVVALTRQQEETAETGASENPRFTVSRTALRPSPSIRDGEDCIIVGTSLKVMSVAVREHC